MAADRQSGAADGVGGGVTLLLQSTVHALVFCTLSQGLPEPGSAMPAFLVASVLLAAGALYLHGRRRASRQ